MRTLARYIRSRLRGESESGAALPMVAGMLVALMGLAAFAVDLGWIYLNTSRLQRAADAAALAGVVHLPGFPALVTQDATGGATANGFPPDTGNHGPLLWEAVGDEGNMLQVTLSTSVPTFFLKVLGFSEIDVVRRATAEYIKPVPIGSPFTSFGDGNNASQAFWASISGQYTSKVNGDAFNSRCDWSRTIGDCVDSSDSNRSLWPGTPSPNPGDIDSNTDDTNPDYRRGGTTEGYYYGIEKGSGSMTVQLYDPRFRRRQNNNNGNGSNPYGCRMGLDTGDCDKLIWGPPVGNNWNSTNGPTTVFTLYQPDSTPLDPYDNTNVVCSRSYSPDNPRDSGTVSWENLCSTSGPSGIYVLHVTTTGGSGSNQYGIRATGAAEKVYGINDISIFANADNATLYLAEILPVHAGKKLILEFYDPGEGAGNASMTIRPARRPGGATNTGVSCNWISEDSDGNQQSSGGSCQLPTTLGGVAQFNNYWVRVTVDIPSTYNCNPDAADPANGCWWRMDMNLNTPHDRTTWTAKVIGNPVRLVPNEP